MAEATGTILPDPDFSCNEVDPINCRFIAGVRPYRETTFRLELDRTGPKPIVHNYGHGGAGITMSWGCADVVRSTILPHVPSGGAIAILGAGVMGLTAATLLRTAGYRVAIYAEKFSGTTSDVAGGQWAPSVVESKPDAASKRQFEEILRVSFRKHLQNSLAYGVSRRTNYTLRESPSFKKVPYDIVPSPTPFSRLPFAHLNRPGFGYETLLVEPPVFLGKLRADLRADPNVTWTPYTFQQRAQIFALPEVAVVNCTGFGSKKLFNDSLMMPIKGQLALVKAQPHLQYLYSTGETYVFPRGDCVVVGGSYEEGVNDEVADPVKCRRILQMARNVFAGHPLMLDEREDWMMRDK